MDMREIMTNCFAKLDAKFIWKMRKKMTTSLSIYDVLRK